MWVCKLPNFHQPNWQRRRITNHVSKTQAAASSDQASDSPCRWSYLDRGRLDAALRYSMRLPRNLGREIFIPARDSRHRIAVFALYRALLRAADRVSLPPDEFSIGIPQLIRRQFRRNAHEVSSRLSFAALTAGYKTLTLLKLARDANSLEYKQILGSLRDREARIVASRFRPVKNTSARRKGEHSRVMTKEPFLLKVSGPGEHPRYAASRPPLPAESLKGQRLVPMVAATADGMPFLRLRKTQQPPTMSRMIGFKVGWYNRNMDKLVQIDEQESKEALIEDRWEELVERQMLDEGVDTESFSKDLKETYSWSVQLSRLWWEWKIDNIWQDWVARGEALQKIVDNEQELADKEQGKEKRAVPARSKTEANVVVHKVQSMPPPINSSPNWPPAQRVTYTDPYLSDDWQTVISSAFGRMMKHTKASMDENSTNSGQ